MSLPARWSQKIEAADPANEIMELQMGPSHPASHGTIKFNLKLDGERIADCDVEVGFLHRAFEKMCEQGTWTQCFPYTDRLNYASPCINNVGFAMAVEKLIGIEAPERAQYLRVIMSEVSRITDHLTCLGMAGHEVGASTISMLLIEGRELLYDLVEAVTGARLTVTWCRVGGVAQDLPEDFNDRIQNAMRQIDGLLRDADKLLSRNRVFIDRMSGVGVIPQKDIISYGVTGPLLRASGVAYDVRKAKPYQVYDRFEFDIPVGERGDNYDRFNVRFREIAESQKIIAQAMKHLPVGPIMIDNPKVALPSKERVYNSIEGLMNHFKLIMEGIKVPPGETYTSVEGANGELGFYIVSDGSGRPYRVRVRPPCFLAMGALNKMLIGHMIPDIITTFGMINMIGGECDR